MDIERCFGTSAGAGYRGREAVRLGGTGGRTGEGDSAEDMEMEVGEAEEPVPVPVVVQVA